ncbi:MAG: ABC transporter permease [Tannerella sp.]|jgi:putative ABC transport system permease protein|nr:ABC transporter permease [Tannerella sp.]
MLLYFKQAWNLIKQEKLFSSIYIIGTGLSITVVMVLSIVFYVKTANIYPETNRDRLLIVKSGAEFYENNNRRGSSLAYSTIEKCFFSLKSAEAVTAIASSYDNYVQPAGSREQVPVTVKYTDTSFWTVFPFRFIDGQSFSEADMKSGVHTAVIAESLAKRIFGRANVTGEYVSLNFRNYRICGVVKDASLVTSTSYALLWIPYSVLPDYKKTYGEKQTLGSFNAYILAPSVADVEKVRQETLANIQRFDQTIEDAEFTVFGQPDRQWQTIFRSGNMITINFGKELFRYGLIFFILLLIPAVSLSGMTESRMERRLSEMGIRRAFGARTPTLMNQILFENFLFTLLGGAGGLLASYFFVVLNSHWILQLIGIGFSNTDGLYVAITPAMLLNFQVFFTALVICFLLNLLSALIPAWRASRRPIIHSLTSNT